MKLGSQNINSLVNEHVGALKATIYIPTDPKMSTQDSTRLKNALQTIKNDPSYDDRELGDSLKKIYEDLVDNDDFWNYQDFGLAVFFDADGYEYFHIPFEITEAEYVSDHFIVSPLVITASADTGFYVLDVNFTNPRLFSGARGNLKEIVVANMPKNIESAIGRDSYSNHSLGDEDNAVGEDEKRYLQMIADAVDAAITYDNRALLLAGTSNRTGNIRNQLKHGHVLSDTLVGSYEKSDIEKIYQDSSEVVRQALRKERDEAVEALGNTAPELVVIGTDEIKEAASTGRIDSLFIPAYRLTEDSVRADDGEKLIIELPADIESIESTVKSVLAQSGKIVAVEIDGYDLITEPKAICRF
jgi:hypothetical protein